MMRDHLKIGALLLIAAGLVGCRTQAEPSVTHDALPVAAANPDWAGPDLKGAAPNGQRGELGARVQLTPQNPKELGRVRWQRDFEAAKTLAKRSGRPLFVLFQEVPGCATCVGFGQSVLSHPLLVESIESDFVPLAIHNNKGGHDREVLERFDEPAWNNPVVRMLAVDERDLITRADGVWSTHGIATRMVAALTASGREVPQYLRWVVSETAPKAARATFGMACYWQGEACLGDIAGVVSTRAGWLDGREVVEVWYDQSKLTRQRIEQLSQARGCGEVVARAKPARSASDSDRKYHLQRSRWRYVPLTPWQASRVNTALANRQDPARWASPRQRQLYRSIATTEATTLAGLVRPDTLAKLPSYEQQLIQRLTRAAID